MYAVRYYANRTERAAAQETNPAFAQWAADTAENDARNAYERGAAFWQMVSEEAQRDDAQRRLEAALRFL